MQKETLIYLKESMRHKDVIRLVQEASERIWYRLPDVTSFEHTCYVNIGKELLKNEVRSIGAMARYYISRAEARHINRTKYERTTNFSELNSESEGDELEFEPEDVLADVESEVIKKEMTALLAQDDHRNRKILDFWTLGNTNSAQISRSLARSIGGNEESHRKYIQRFRKSCSERLSAAI